MKSKALLINYTGYPLSVSSLLPDGGLATLAGALISSDHETKIMDFSNVEIIPKLYPQEQSKEFDTLLESINKKIKLNEPITREMIFNLNIMYNKIRDYRFKKVDNFAHKINSEIKKFSADLVGFKLYVGEGFECSVKIAEKIKELNPDIKIFAGGPQVDTFGEIIYQVSDVFDALAIGEGDETVKGLAEFCEGNMEMREIPNLIYKKDSRLNKTKFERVKSLEDLDFPMYSQDIYPALKGDSKIKIFYIDESRGCPNSCNFCLHPIKSGNYWRTKSAQRIIQEMEGIINKFGTNAFRFSGSNTPPFLNKTLAEKITEKGLSVKYTCFGHVGKFGDNYFKLLKSAGCQAIFFGIESGSQFILDEAINKNIKVEDIRQTIDKAKNAGLFVITSWIVPSPFETEETKQDTFNLIREIRPDSCLFTIPIVTMGTEWYKNYKNFNIQIKSKEELNIALMNYQPKLSFPTQLWKPFKYKVNEKDFKELSRESSMFISRLCKIGIRTDITDELYLMSLHTNYQLKEFRDKCREFILKGDYVNLKSLVREINKNLLCS